MEEDVTNAERDVRMKRAEIKEWFVYLFTSVLLTYVCAAFWL